MAKLSKRKTVFSVLELQQAIVADWAEYLQHSHRNEHTHGAWVRRKYNVADAKQLAIAGYAPVFRIFEQLQRYSDDITFFGLLAYKKLLLVMDDINILYRKGVSGLHFCSLRDQ